MDISELVAHTFVSVEGFVNGPEILFTNDEGRKYKMFHERDCCESVYVDDIVGDLEDLVGSPVLWAYESRSSSLDEQHDDPKHPETESFTWTFYRMGTIKGSVAIKFYGTSNGYYSEAVDIEEIKKGEEPN